MPETLNHIIDSLRKFEIPESETGRNGKEKIICFSEKLDSFDLSALLDSKIIGTRKVFYFSKPDDQFEFVGIDRFIELNKEGNSTFQSLRDKFLSINERIEFYPGKPAIRNLPLIQGYVKFKSKKTEDCWRSFTGLSFAIPKLIFVKDGNECWFICIFSHAGEIDTGFAEKILELANNTGLDSEKKIIKKLKQTPEPGKAKELWKNIVDKGKQKIFSGELKKIVLSHKYEIELSADPDFRNVVSDLGLQYPQCYIFLTGQDNKIFFGTSPELFIKKKNDEIIFEAVAGSVPRGYHRHEEISFEKKLLLDPKLKSEHSLVKEFILGKISGILPGEKLSEDSFVRKLDNIQHLVTKISVSIKDEPVILRLIDELFPTPAVCGLPEGNALQIIHELEQYDRGLYSGLIGWFDLNLNGEMVVGIRSALYDEKKITAYAGAGILGDSDADEEFFETELKLQPILSLFGNEEKS